MTALTARTREVLKRSFLPMAIIGRSERHWAIRQAAHELRHGTPAEQFERAAQNLAAQYGYDAGVLIFNENRYAFGSLSNNWDSGSLRKLYARAACIASARREVLEAAE